MKVFIGCGSNPQIPTDYLEETKKVCQKLCDLNCSLIFGAYSKGMMGLCYETFISNQKEVLGVTLDAYHDDLANLPNMKIIETDTSFKRLEYIYNESDIFLILPGGTGTLNELFGLMEEMKTSKIQKKIIIYNYKNFYKELFDYVRLLNKKGFAYLNEIDKLIIIDNIKDLERVIKNERN